MSSTREPAGVAATVSSSLPHRPSIWERAGLDRSTGLIVVAAVGAVVVAGEVLLISNVSHTSPSATRQDASVGSPVSTPSPSPSASADANVVAQYVALARATNQKKGLTAVQIQDAKSYSGNAHQGTVAQVNSGYATLAQETQDFNNQLSQLKLPAWVLPDVQKVLADNGQLIAVYQKEAQAKSWAEIAQLDPQLCDCNNNLAQDVGQVRRDLGLPPPTPYD